MYFLFSRTLSLLTFHLVLILLIQHSATAPIELIDYLSSHSLHTITTSNLITEDTISNQPVQATVPTIKQSHSIFTKHHLLSSTNRDEDPAMIPHSKGEEKAASDTAKDELAQTTPGEKPKSPPPGVDPNAPVTDEGRPTANSTAGNATYAFSIFKLKQMVEADDNFQLNSVFVDGALTGAFEGNPNTSSLTELKDINDDSWYKENSYMDRIAFQFQFAPGSTDYAFEKPILTISDDSGISPEVHDYHSDSENGQGTFTILYKCQVGGKSKSRISFHMKVTSERNIDTTWVKECGHGRHEHIEFGYITYDHKTALFNPDGTYGTEEKKMLDIGPLDLSTELTMKLNAPAQTLDFLDPHVESNSKDVGVYLRGTISKGTLERDQVTKFSILYECKATTTAQIKFSIAVPPWDNVTATWRKDCGGNNARSLLIGTTGPGTYDVMLDGELDAEYNVSDSTTLESVPANVKRISEDINSAKFYLTNSDETSDIHIQTISTTMSDPGVVSVSVRLPVLPGSSFLSSTGGTLARKETKSLLLQFICKSDGKSLVLVTLPTLRYKNVEFGFIKECKEPKVLHHSGFLSTAGSILGALAFLICLAGTGLCIYLRRRSKIKYAPVSTEEVTDMS